MEDPVGYDGGNPVERANVAVAHALAQRADAPADDHFETQAKATLEQWAAVRRELASAYNIIDRLRGDDAEMRARIDELTRANSQLSASLEESLRREGEAKEQAGYLKGIMTSAAAALMEGIRPAQQPQWFSDLVRRVDQRRPSQQ